MWHKSPVGLIPDADVHDFQGVRDHHKDIGVNIPGNPFQARQFLEGNDRVQDLNVPARIPPPPPLPLIMVTPLWTLFEISFEIS